MFSYNFILITIVVWGCFFGIVYPFFSKRRKMENSYKCIGEIIAGTYTSWQAASTSLYSWKAKMRHDDGILIRTSDRGISVLGMTLDKKSYSNDGEWICITLLGHNPLEMQVKVDRNVIVMLKKLRSIMKEQQQSSLSFSELNNITNYAREAEELLNTGDYKYLPGLCSR